MFQGSILLFTYVIKPWLLHFWDLGAWLVLISSFCLVIKLGLGLSQLYAGLGIANLCTCCATVDFYFWNYVFCRLPMYFLSLILNVSMFQVCLSLLKTLQLWKILQEVSDGGHDCVRGSKASKTPSMPLSTLLATMCYSIIMQQIMLVQVKYGYLLCIYYTGVTNNQAAVVGAIPELIPVSPSWKILMWFIKFAITSWMASFYCFEYTWIRKGETVLNISIC